MSVEPGPSEAPVPAATPPGGGPQAELGHPGAGRARALLVGKPAAWRDGDLGGALDLRRVGPADVLPALGDGAPDLLLLDGQLPAATLTEILEAVGQPGRGGRPVVVVVTEGGRRTQVEARLVDHADDFVNGSLGEEVLLARVRVALRMRAIVDELARKNGELEGLYARVDSMARRMAEELRLASHVQRSLLPPPMHHAHLDLAGEFIPVREIGGDYYDLIPLDRGRLAVAIGDVMGKGVPAALLAANLKACLRAQLEASATAPEETIARVNRLFWEVTPKGLFASLFFGVLDHDAGVMDYVNAGHEHPFVVRADGSLVELAEGGTVLGLLEKSQYRRGHAPLGRADMVVFFSDGLTDRTSPAGEIFGVERLKRAAVRSGGDAARIALYSLLGEVQGFSGGLPAEDDVTLIVARVR
jgi:serine phosphatase RsbU (regulator of sigma subunit)